MPTEKAGSRVPGPKGSRVRSPHLNPRPFDPSIPFSNGPALAIGGFDGVHLGHRQIIARTKALADELKAPAEVLTFDPLPAQLIHPDFTYVLTPLEEKAGLLWSSGSTRSGSFISTPRRDRKALSDSSTNTSLC